MSWFESPKYEKKVAISRWADRYTTRFDQALSASWPDLSDRLHRAVGQLTWLNLTVGPGKKFKDRFITPAVEGWVKLHVVPLATEALDEFRNLAPLVPEQVRGDAAVDAEMGSALEVKDIFALMAGPGGVAVASVTLHFAIVSTTSLLVFTTVVVHWPVLIGGLLVGGLLSLFGFYSLAQLRTTLQDRLEKRLLPPINDAVIGDGVKRNGKHVPSLRCQLIDRVNETAAKARRDLDEKG